MNTETLSTLNIEALQGLWRRDWIRSESTFDDATNVYWAQAEELFVDLRIPHNRLSVSHLRCLADLDAADLYQLTKAEGFAGYTHLVNDICTWNRVINWHGQSESVDAGKLWFDQSTDRLMEDGVHAHYQEQWQKSHGQSFKAYRIACHSLSGLVLLSETHFIFGIGDPNANSTAPLMNALARGTIPRGVSQLFESQYCYGVWNEGIGVVQLSTNPFSEAKVVLTLEGERLTYTRQQFDGNIEVSELDFA